MPSEPPSPRLLRRIILPGAGVLLVIATQIAVVEVFFRAGVDALAATRAEERSAAVSAAAIALSAAQARGATRDDLDDMLRRLRDGQRLDDAVLLGPDLAVLAGRDRSRAQRLESLAADPVLVEGVRRGGGQRSEAIRIAGTPGERRYVAVPAKDGSPWAVLRLEATALIEDRLGPLVLARRLGWGVAIASGLLLLAAVRLAVWWLDRSRRALAQAANLANLGALAASVAHEVRNPLATVLSGVQLLAARPGLPPDDRDLLAGLEDEVRRANDQVETLLDLARDPPLRLGPVDAADLLRRLAAVIEPQARAAGCRLTVSPPSAVVIVQGDQRKLHQALVNLLLNAVQAAGRGGSVEVSADVTASAVEIRIADDGPGVPAALRPTLFEPFATGRPDGLGLGLPQARRIIRRHGGEIDLLDREPRGTVARVVLPQEASPCAS